MTDYEREQIYELRRKSMGYKAIGTALALAEIPLEVFAKEIT